MSILKELKNNKGTVSSALGKELSKRILAGETGILDEALDLVCYGLPDEKEKGVRAGAAKTVELTAEKKPELVAPFLEKLLPAFNAPEPQTRWMLYMTFGYCFKLNHKIAQQAFPCAVDTVRSKKEGQLCLVGSADLYLGRFGSFSKENAESAYAILLESSDTVIKNEHDWLLEAFMNIIPGLPEKHNENILSFAEEYANHPRKKTRERVEKIRAMVKAE